ncbi:hypothetical protein GJ744_004367 [Endocarpon pusillum]|uniref:Uncharacterized protein n=1 Tax=Endocarpon pusillum TaxID=364733 RepID=A0A8H7AW75_9EURO|nr:hypothetical protein GJ744_004367 [Endocarpon pusillum]
MSIAISQADLSPTAVSSASAIHASSAMGAKSSNARFTALDRGEGCKLSVSSLAV